VEGSSFLTNCGSCELCVITYSMQNGSVSLLEEIVNTLTAQINRCEDTPGKVQVSGIASQASQLSSFNAQLATRVGSAFLSTPTPTSNVDLSSILRPTVNTAPGKINRSSYLLSSLTLCSHYFSGIVQVVVFRPVQFSQCHFWRCSSCDHLPSDKRNDSSRC
jgi:hypothetical protein